MIILTPEQKRELSLFVSLAVARDPDVELRIWESAYGLEIEHGGVRKTLPSQVPF